MGASHLPGSVDPADATSLAVFHLGLAAKNWTFTMKNGAFTMKHGGFTMKKCVLTMKNRVFP